MVWTKSEFQIWGVFKIVKCYLFNANLYKRKAFLRNSGLEDGTNTHFIANCWVGLLLYLTVLRLDCSHFIEIQEAESHTSVRLVIVYLGH